MKLTETQKLYNFIKARTSLKRRDIERNCNMPQASISHFITTKHLPTKHIENLKNELKKYGYK